MSHQFIEKPKLSAQEVIILNRIKCDPNQTVNYYAEKLAKPPQLVAQVMESNGIEVKYKGNEVKVVKPTIKRDEVLRVFEIAPILSAIEIAKIVGVDDQYVRHCVREAGLKFIDRKAVERKLKREADKRYIIKNNHKSFSVLAKEIGMSKWYVQVLKEEIKQDGQR